MKYQIHTRQISKPIEIQNRFGRRYGKFSLWTPGNEVASKLDKACTAAGIDIATAGLTMAASYFLSPIGGAMVGTALSFIGDYFKGKKLVKICLQKVLKINIKKINMILLEKQVEPFRNSYSGTNTCCR